MRTSLLAALLYTALLTAVVFSREGPLTESAKRDWAASLQREIVRDESRVVAHEHTLFSGSLIDEVKTQLRSERDTTRPERLLSVAAASPCNPRASPCF